MKKYSLLICMLFFITVFFVGCGNKNSSVEDILYLKNCELFYVSSAANKSYQLTTETASPSKIEDELKPIVYSSDSAKKVFYIDNVYFFDGDLFIKDLMNLETEPLKIDSNVSHFEVSRDGNIITYLKEGNIYQYFVDNDEMGNRLVCDISLWRYDRLKNSYNGFASETNRAFLSETGKVIYCDNDSLFIYDPKQGQEFIDNNVSGLLISDDGNVVCYLKDKDLFRKINNNPVEKISSNVDYSTFPPALLV